MSHPQEELELTSFAAETALGSRCGQCGKPGSSQDGKLRKCSSCRVALYCSRECQKAAWRSHKSQCRLTASETGVQNERPFSYVLSGRQPSPYHLLPSRISEYSSRASLLQDFREYLDIHFWAITQGIRAAVHLVPGGVEAVMSATAPLLMNFIVFPHQVPSPTPANSWCIEQWTIHSVHSLLNAAPNIKHMWGDARPEYRELAAQMAAENDPRYLGLLPVIYTFKDTNHFMLTYQPLYRPRDPELVRAQSTQDAILDFKRMCESYTSQGLPLKRVEGDAFALPGRLVKLQKKQWGWTPLFDDWTGQRVEFNGQYNFKTRKCIPHLMQFVTSL